MPAPAENDRAFYVLGDYTESPWVLTDERPLTIDECRRAIRWQGQPRGHSDYDWIIAYWDADAQTFREHNGERTFTVQRGPYTVAAFERFMATLEPRP